MKKISPMMLVTSSLAMISGAIQAQTQCDNGIKISLSSETDADLRLRSNCTYMLQRTGLTPPPVLIGFGFTEPVCYRSKGPVKVDITVNGEQKKGNVNTSTIWVSTDYSSTVTAITEWKVAGPWQGTWYSQDVIAIGGPTPGAETITFINSPPPTHDYSGITSDITDPPFGKATSTFSSEFPPNAVTVTTANVCLTPAP
jgi:hypothetical protein